MLSGPASAPSHRPDSPAGSGPSRPRAAPAGNRPGANRSLQLFARTTRRGATSPRAEEDTAGALPDVVFQGPHHPLNVSFAERLDQVRVLRMNLHQVVIGLDGH